MIYIFDLDGTLCTQEEDYSKAEPYEERIFKVNELYEQGNKIIIDTARGSNTGIDWRNLTEQQLRKWKLKYHSLRVGEKYCADFYIDDKAYNSNEFFK